MSRYAFPLCIQLALPKDPEDASFAETLALLKDLGFYGVELNVIDFDVWTPAVVKDLLSRYDLKMSHLATGACARTRSPRSFVISILSLAICRMFLTSTPPGRF